MYDFIAAYFLFLPMYPLAVIDNFSSDYGISFLWLAIAIIGLFLAYKFDLSLFRKIFIAVWVMPGTIVCGAAGIMPWPLALTWYGTCAGLFSISVTLIFNFILIFSFSFLISKVMGKRNAA